jgi:glycosyltransferase involved in cell wall biosynthesis
MASRHLHERKAFLFVARVAPEKGVDSLIDAYKAYRARIDDPWPLIVCGTGRLAHRLAGVEGVDARGFVQPTDLPAIFGEAACMVLPSLFEPYGVALHEAAIAGLGIICSEACGAADDFIDPDEINGRVVPTGDAAALTEAMLAMSHRGPDELEAVRMRSVELAARISPNRWARTLLDLVDQGPPDR